MQKAILIYLYADDHDVVRVVLVRDDAEEKRLATALQDFVHADQQYIDGKADDPAPIEGWLSERGFQLLETDRWIWPFPGPDQVPWTPILCSLCRQMARKQTAHLHQRQYIGDECCWDERLRASE